MKNKIIISNKASDKFLKLLKELDIDFLKSIDNMLFNLNYYDHPDLSLFYFDDILYVEENISKYYFENLKDMEIKTVDISNFKNGEVALNISFNEKYFFHNEKFTPRIVFDNLIKNRKYIKINQGYANCSMICFKDTIITSDVGIYETLLENNINVKLVSTEGILLNGYKNGFIGGTCGFVSKDKLLFYGDVTNYKDYDIIKSVADDENVELIFPKGEDFVDLGGIISIY